MSEIKKTDNTNSYTLLAVIKYRITTLELVWQFLIKLNIHLPNNSEFHS
jgi:hypothetical protein